VRGIKVRSFRAVRGLKFGIAARAFGVYFFIPKFPQNWHFKEKNKPQGRKSSGTKHHFSSSFLDKFRYFAAIGE
jgi:hypothetical protein